MGNSKKRATGAVGLSRQSGPLCGRCGAARSVWLFAGMAGRPRDALETVRACPRVPASVEVAHRSQSRAGYFLRFELGV